MEHISTSWIILSIGSVLFVGYYVRMIMNRLKIPDVTGYVILGVVAGALVFRRVDGLLDSMGIVSDMALAIIAFIVGHELNKDVILKLGKPIIFIAFFEAFGAFLLVFCGLYFTGWLPLHSSLIFGAIASATAPAATVFVIHQYRSQGPLTSTILAVVGIDDAIALIIYVFAAAVAKSTFKGGGFSISVVARPIVTVALSLVTGFVFGYLFCKIFKNARNREQMAMGFTAVISLILGLTEYLHFSELLAIMTFSAFVTNYSPSLARRSNEVLEQYSPIFMPLFFIFAGAHLDVSMVRSVALLCLWYTFLRATGKITGSSFGAVLGKAPPVVRKYIGMGLIPQIGVAVALALSVRKEFGDPSGPFGEKGAYMSSMVINVLLCSTVITEIVGPLMTKFALMKSGEAKNE
jgi:Kef-type K+ transport system membrane component KefB